MESGQRKDPGGRFFFGHVSIELVRTPVPLDRIQRCRFQVVVALQCDRMTDTYSPGNIQTHSFQALTAAHPCKTTKNWSFIVSYTRVVIRWDFPFLSFRGDLSWNYRIRTRTRWRKRESPNRILIGSFKIIMI